MLKALIQRVVSVRDDEIAAMLWATAYGFAILFSYYILRAVRDEISSADRGNLQIIWTVVFFVMLVAVSAYSWTVSRFQRGVFVPLANRFFISNLILFYAALVMLPQTARPWIDRVFYVWASVFALFVVTVFWGFMADCFRSEQGKRLFGFIAVGSSLGGIVGSATTASLVEVLPDFTLLLVACVPLELASRIVGYLHRQFAVRQDSVAQADQPVGGSAFSGIGFVFRSRYLMSIAAFIALMTFASTILYFQQAHLIGEAFTDRAERTAFYATIDLWANALTLLFQVYLTAHIIRLAGIGISLALVPVAMVIGFLTLGIYPLLAVLVVLQVAYRAGRYGITRPAREVLFTVVSREEKYKSKAFIDAAVYRGGDLVSGWAYAGLAAVGLSVGAIALVAAPVAAVWVMLGLKLGPLQEEKAGAPPTVPAPVPAAP